MTDAFRIGGRPGQLLALALVACALLLRLVVPQGWMPVETARGWQVTLCSGVGPMRMVMAVPMLSGMKGGHHGSGHEDHGPNDHPCAFSSLTMALDEPPPLLLDLPMPVVGAWLTAGGIMVAVGRGLAAPPPPSTGPPHA